MNKAANKVLKEFLLSRKKAEPAFEHFTSQVRILEVTRDQDLGVKHYHRMKGDLHEVISKMFGGHDRLVSFHVLGPDSKPYIEATVQSAIGNHFNEKRYLIRPEGLGMDAHMHILGQCANNLEEDRLKGNIRKLEGYLKKVIDLRTELGSGYRGVPSTVTQLEKDIEDAKKALKEFQSRPKETFFIEEMDD
jgi:flagellin-like hook-associated protein FlgL